MLRHFGIILLIPVILADWVDPDTPEYYFETKPLTQNDQRQYRLVFSDEFNVDGRTFRDGHDPRWTAINKNDYTNAALHYYSHDNVITQDGVLRIRTERKINEYKAFDEDKKRFYVDRKYIQSGMVQGWNKFCFTGGIVEFSAKLPGKHNIGGLWPALWLLGNLARATYVGSSDYVWPWSYNKCDERYRMSQEISACNRVNHYGLEAFRGRGAPEIDIIEAMQGDASRLPSTHIRRPYQSASYQVSPGLVEERPVLGERPRNGHWYEGLEYGEENETDLNPFFYGVLLEHKPKSYTYQSDALSANLQLNESFYTNQHLYRVEWQPPDEDGNGGYIKWFTDGRLIYGVYGESLNLTQTEIPSEPMYLIMNTAVSSHWGFPAPCPPGCACKCFECGVPECRCGMPSGYCENFPAEFDIDYVHVYQAVDDASQSLGCSPNDRPTATFIEGHLGRYKENDQSFPLMSVQIGGGLCSRHSDCGGLGKGQCSSLGVCSCSDGWVGPQCRSHNGHFHVNKTANRIDLNVSFVVIPWSLLLILGLILFGFAVAMVVSARKHHRETQYQKLTGIHSSGRGNQVKVPASPNGFYQNNHYGLPPKRADLTYCVIDDRLIDE